MDALNVIFMGSAELSCASLSALLNAEGINVQAVVTQPDKPKGRHLKLTPSPVKELALASSLPVLQPVKARDPKFADELQAFGPSLIVVAAYGQILPKTLLDMPRYGCINVHTSLLPKYRGAGPIQWAILNGETETGVTIMKMDVGLDTGDILTQERTLIRPEDDGATLHDRLAVMGAELLVRTIPGYVTGQIQPRPQQHEKATYAPKIKKQDGQIDWLLPAEVIWNKVRGMTPWPGAFTFMEHGGQAHRLKILRAQPVSMTGAAGSVLQADKEALVVGCGKGSLKILDLQPEGSRPMDHRQFLAGHKIAFGYGFSGAGPMPSIQ